MVMLIGGDVKDNIHVRVKSSHLLLIKIVFSAKPQPVDPVRQNDVILQ